MSSPLFMEVSLILNQGFELTTLNFDEDLYNLSPLLGELYDLSRLRCYFSTLWLALVKVLFCDPYLARQ